MSSIRFIHAADLHIESPYKGVSQSNEGLGAALVQYAKQAYDDLISKCIEEKIDFLLIAGDSFDSGDASLKAQFHFVEGLKRLGDHSIKAFIICGNHDPLNSWLSGFSIPENVHLFKTNEVERVPFIKEGVEVGIYGSSFIEREEKKNIAQTYRRHPQDQFSIGILHGMLAGKDGHDPYCPFNEQDLRASGMDYWALGHIHKREVIIEENPLAIYPGNLQGRHFNESGEKGCYLIEIASNHIVKKQFIPIAKVIFERATLDISDIGEVEDLIDTVRAYSRTLQNDNSLLLRLQLEGQTTLFNDLQDEIRVKHILDSLNEYNDYKGEFVFYDKFINKTAPVINIDERAKSNDFIAKLISHFLDYENDETKLKAIGERIFEEIRGKSDAYYVNELSIQFDDVVLLKELMEQAKLHSVGGLILEEKKQ